MEILYLSSIRPPFEYADVVWDSAPLHQSFFQNLEKLQISASRTVTGTNNYSSKNLLYKETQWLPLSTRRIMHRLTLFYKIFIDECPRHLRQKFLYYNNYTNPYATRHRNDLNIPLCRTETFRQSFFPATLRLWNALDNSIKMSESISVFKSRLETHFEYKKSNSYFYLGNRKHTSILSSIRTKSSQLKSQLFLNGLAENSFCRCGQIETPKHYFFECIYYHFERQSLLEHILQLEILLYGYGNNETVMNTFLCYFLSEFIEQTERFL